ncbi:twin transmembrane helix small protein [Kiloniella laminariae]|uniref:Twin transmembrane helix small protein n=1 Tax=Kiloniella laminariae TaxID=454162 RepID=A0ABT4LL27_9PROT|nr:twin transmembrane helix small protein [Kiloniella laminariae]MCZ4281655.1 twin transmembrane helix small protein [Kiloniella laminariae]
MEVFLNILIVLSLAAVLIILFTGLFTMAKGGDFNKNNANRFMRYRVIAQGIALVVLVLALLAKGS